jgi:hypothetical protein
VATGSATAVGLASGDDVIVSSSAFFPSLAASPRVANIGGGSFDHQLIMPIITPPNAEPLYSSSLSNCGSLSSISFENGSPLKRIESSSFRGSALKSIVIPQDADFLMVPRFQMYKAVRKLMVTCDFC